MMPTKHPVIFLNSNFRFASKIVEEHPLDLDNFLETIFAPPPAPLLSILYMGLMYHVAAAPSPPACLCSCA